MQTRTIDIDLDVHKALEVLRQSLAETENDILRRELLPKVLDTMNGDSPGRLANVRPSPGNGKDKSEGLYIKGVHFWDGMQLRKSLKGVEHRAEVKDGAIVYNGNRYRSPSAPACDAADSSVNGWIFWEYQDPHSGRWYLLDKLRKR